MAAAAAGEVSVRFCGNARWVARALGRTERVARTHTLRLGREAEETKREAAAREDETSVEGCGFRLSKWEEAEICLAMVYLAVAHVSAATETILVITLPLFIARYTTNRNLLPLYGLIVSSYSMGFLLSASLFTSQTHFRPVGQVLFSSLRRMTIATAAASLLLWTIALLVFLRVWDETYSQLALLLLARFGMGLCGGQQQLAPLLFFRHLSSRLFRQRDDLHLETCRFLVGPSLALCVALGLPPLSPEQYQPSLRPQLVFNSLSLPAFLGIGFSVTLLAMSLRLSTDNALGSMNHHSREHHERLASAERSEPSQSWWSSSVLRAECATQFVLYGIAWSLQFTVRRAFSFSVFELFTPVFAGALCAIVASPKTLAWALRLGKYRLGYSFLAGSRACVLVGILLLAACLLCLVLQQRGEGGGEGDGTAPVFAPGFLLGAALLLVLNSIDRLPRGGGGGGEVSVAFDANERWRAKTWGRLLGALVVGSLLEDAPADGSGGGGGGGGGGVGGARLGWARVRWLEWWAALNLAVLAWAFYCVAEPWCWCRCCCSCCGDGAEAGAAAGGGAATVPLAARPRGDPDCICVSLAADTLDLDVEDVV